MLLRHGRSAGNGAGVFTGWLDVPLTERGRAEAVRAGELLVEHGCAPSVAYTSVLARARTAARCERSACGSTAWGTARWRT